MTDKQETVVFQLKGVAKYCKDGQFVDLPANWEFIPAGDPALTRRIKANAPDYWVVKRKFGKKIFNVGICAQQGLADSIAQQLSKEREDPAYQKKLEAGRKRRDKVQAQYQEDFEAAVIQFLDFHPRWQKLAETLAKKITLFTTPVGSGTVARTKLIPLENRARAAVMAWLRHNTSDYDERYIPHIAGMRQEVRRKIAGDSLLILKTYRRGHDAPKDCPLQKALKDALD